MAEAKIKAVTVIGVIGIAVILTADFLYKWVPKGFDRQKMTGWF